ncbi:hypothetical protein DM02DRAFT_612340 [Periconia macrospinosa]|uniref:SnoaL-like domain-containing protein n=1 Tax=Periconia macrospinosa TaxID=97972 RepID=A0A2V1E264_9PLEO|nr:hypothetical protein DM02DRAFT_612340 [Periconia macrospinosa]
MRVATAIFVAIFSLAQAKAYNETYNETSIQPDYYEAIHQAEFKLAETLDTKNYSGLGEVMTKDVVYDSRPLGAYGGLSEGLENTIANIKAAFGDAMNAHYVSNALIEPRGKDSAYVVTYLTWSRWDPAALDDPKKTFRIYERCDDLFVIDDGKWKLKYSLVTQLGPKPESPYFAPA